MLIDCKKADIETMRKEAPQMGQGTTQRDARGGCGTMPGVRPGFCNGLGPQHR